MDKVSQLSVFFPAYNEEENIKETVLKAVEVLNEVASKWEIIVVNDGSTDKTRKVVEGLAKKYKKIRLINHKKNRGYGGAIKTGLFESKCSLIAYTDSDGQFDFEEIKKFLPKLRNADLVVGFRKKRTDSFYRRMLARILWLADWILFGLDVKDVDCGFKVFKKDIVGKIGKLATESAITETEFVVRAKKAGYRIAEIGVNHNPRMEGKQTGGKLKVIIRAAGEGLNLWWVLIKEKFLT